MKFLVDAQLPPSLALWLRGTGREAVHVEDIGLRDADDIAIRNYVKREGYVLITKDRDFVSAGKLHSDQFQIVWIRTGNAPNRVLLERLSAGWSHIAGHLEAGARIVELR